VNEALMTVRTAVGLAVVLGLLALLVWALRRGSLGLSRLAPRGAISVETALSIGDRRSLAIVGVEGRRMLVGLTPTTISFLTDLAPGTTPAPPAEAP
jgi:flagellar biosynthetic protein FliO